VTPIATILYFFMLLMYTLKLLPEKPVVTNANLEIHTKIMTKLLIGQFTQAFIGKC